MLEGNSQAGRTLINQREAAARLGVSFNTLRSYLDALAVIEDMDRADKGVGSILRSRSVDAVRAFGRWSRFDRLGAVEFVREHPEFSSVAVRKAERLARQKIFAPQPNLWSALLASAKKRSFRTVRIRRDIVAAWRSRWQTFDPPRMLDELSGMVWDFRFHPVAGEYERQLGLEGAAYLPGAPSWMKKDRELFTERLRRLPGYVEQRGAGVVALMRMPRFALPEIFRRESRNFQFRSMLLAERYPLVLLPLPDPAARDAFQEGMVEVPCSDEGEKMALSLRDHQREWESSNEGTDPPATLLLTGPQRGVILLTTPDTLFADLFEVL